MFPRGTFLLLLLFLVHCIGIYLFTKGFLLSRLSLPDRNECGHDGCTSLATHKRAVLLVIDALRFDFISSHPPQPASPYHHNILTLPRELTAARPQHSFIFNAYADPPTITLQRIKGLTTGSLPTFVDVGESFGGSAINEDSLLHQFVAAGRKVAFAGDDTWMTVFPDILDHNMSFPFDSFNVEDLHTVDEGVIANLLPMVKNCSLSWDLAIGHGLGVDHAGHRVGPEHPVMKAKLQQMNGFLAELIEALDEDTLFILLGDHGMDRAGNHGGDSTLETMSAVWMYSKGPALSQGSMSFPSNLVPTTVFPGETVSHRSIQQIDLVPTISLLLGLPIPFNNLGSIIPEIFDRSANNAAIQRALELNANQIKKYLDAYRDSRSGGELDGFWPQLSESWKEIQAAPSPEESLAATIVATYSAYGLLGDEADNSEERLQSALSSAFKAGAAGLALGSVAYFPLENLLEGVYLHHVSLFGSALASTLTFTHLCRPTLRRKQLTSISIIPVLHALCFASNSFTVWEDRIVLFLIITSLVPAFLTGFTAPTARLRGRILGFSAVFAACVRLMAFVTVCREEQHPYCTVTFYALSASSAPPVLALIVAPLGAFSIPFLIRRVLGISKSENGLARIFFPWVLTSALLAGTGFWFLEWAHSTEFFGDDVNAWFRLIRTVLARTCVAAITFGGVSLWWMSPVCLQINTDDSQASSNKPEQKKQAAVLGFANAFGSPYLVFWTIFLSVVWLCTQLMGQIVLGLATIALLAHLEVIDSVRDVRGLSKAFASNNPSTALDLNVLGRELSFSEVVPLALLAVHTFHGTGHQSTIPSLQWKTAFIFTSTVSFPFSQVTAITNTLGPHFLMGLASPLVVLWNLPPVPTPGGLKTSSLRAGLAIMLYFTILLLGSATCAAVLRRHLMVWKIFAPRYMFAVISLLAIDLGVIVGIGIGVGRVRERIERIFKRIA
ncbi:alkaline-phosphatase-like protein [Chiua virens]|nr:alkaline-phosphatase-like protein [Chiua virens]